MRVVHVLIVACVVSQSAFAEGLECRRVADPTPRLSCVERPTTAEAPSTTVQPRDSWGSSDAARRDTGYDRDAIGTRTR